MCIRDRYKTPIISIEEFSGEWENDRVLLRDLKESYLKHRFSIFKVFSKDHEHAAVELSPTEYVEYLRGLRSIELETGRISDLENGFIENSKQFVPHDEDWT